MSDARTLRLAHPDFGPEKVEGLITYQRTLLRALMETSGDDWAGRFAFGHAKGLKASKLDTLEQKQITQAAASYCGRRFAAEQVKHRLSQLKAKGANVTEKEAAILEKAPAELAALEDFSELEQTLGPVTMASFRARDLELLDLHRSMAIAEGRGHIHPRGPA